MGNLKKSVKTTNSNHSKLETRKVGIAVKNKSDNSLRLTEVSEEELKCLRIDVYPYLM